MLLQVCIDLRSSRASEAIASHFSPQSSRMLSRTQLGSISSTVTRNADPAVCNQLRMLDLGASAMVVVHTLLENHYMSILQWLRGHAVAPNHMQGLEGDVSLISSTGATPNCSIVRLSDPNRILISRPSFEYGVLPESRLTTGFRAGSDPWSLGRPISRPCRSLVEHCHLHRARN